MTLLDTILVPFYTLFPKLKRTLPSSKPLASLSISSTAIHLTPGAVLGQDDGEGQWPDHPEDFHIPLFDTGVFLNELANLHLLPQKLGHDADSDKSEAPTHPEQLLKEARTQAPAQLAEGTWRGTKLALTKIYDLIEKRYSSYMDTVNFEPAVPSPLTMQQKREYFTFTNGSDNYPPHLDLTGNKSAADLEASSVQKSTLSPTDIFSRLRLAQLSTLLPALMPKTFIAKAVDGVESIAALARFGGFGTPDAGIKVKDVEDYNRRKRHQLFWKDIFDLPNVGDLQDWYTDARFAQQHFTGANPTTIERASDHWLAHFSEASKAPADRNIQQMIKNLTENSRDSLYMQDYSYFRKAANVDESAIIQCEFDEPYKEGNETEHRKGFRYGCASVCLFYLTEAGTLHPLSVVVDWRGSADKSLTIYNRELIKRDVALSSLAGKAEGSGKKLEAVDEAEDWPWRYAKTCVQCSDWIRHELTVHLTHTHLIEESIIVAANRQLPPEHPVFRLLYPHWQKTLSLNAAARATLVPDIVIKLIGFEDKQAYTFLQNAYETFDFQGQYVPTDLRRRGFEPKLLNDRKFRNYAYARCVYSMWYKIRSYVVEMLRIEYDALDTDTEVKEDQNLQNWSEEMRKLAADGGANIKSFPTLTTFDDLVDCVTMCIHIASPQHTAVNYLQNYYQAFVINKPPCLYAPLPNSLEELLRYTEDDLVAALPMNHPQAWLMASHIPYLLSFKPGDKESLIVYAASKYHVYKYKTSKEDKATALAAARFYKALADSEKEFREYGMATDDSDKIAYNVLSPVWNAVSILI